MSGRLKVAALISGRGTNLQALIDAAKDPAYPAEIVMVISNRPGAKGLERAEAAGIPAVAIDHKAHDSREAFEAVIQQTLEKHGAELITTPGFMRILTNSFVEQWPGKIVNIHPSLLPSFPGTKVHEQALAAGVKVSGCTVHFAVPEVDAGPIIGQAAVPVHEDDTPDTLAARILKAEHKLLPRCIRLIAEGRVRTENGRTLVDARPSEFEVISPGSD
jgi:phosphoribosylglycinamide formyltransferase-1